MTIYTSNTLGDRTNTYYRNQVNITDVDSLREAIQTDHVMNSFVNDQRSNANFTQSDCLYADVDNSHSEKADEWFTIEDFRMNFSQFSYYLYTSKSHQKEKEGSAPRDKYHILFPINTISDGHQLSQALKALISTCPYFDPAVKDLGRFFFGNLDANIYTNTGESVIDSLDLTADYSVSVTAEAVSMADLGEGSGRNEKLFSIGCAMSGKGNTLKEIDDELTNYNSRMATPISRDELKVIIGQMPQYIKKEIDGPTLSESISVMDQFILHGEAFTDAEFPDTKTFIPGLLTAGMTMFAADSKFGKSWLTLQMGIALATGEKLLGVQCRKSKVLLMPLEDIGKQLQDRFNKLGCPKAPKDLSVLLYDPSFVKVPDKLAMLTAIIKKHNFEVVVIDTYSRYMGIPEGGGNAYQNESVVLEGLRQVSLDTGCALLVVTHTNQSNRSNGDQHKINGSTAFEGTADNIWIADKGGLSVTGRTIPQETFKWKLSGTEWVSFEGGEEMISTATINKAQRRDVLDIIVGECLDWKAPKDISEAISEYGWSKDKRSKAYKELVLTKRLEKGTDGKYRSVHSED